jgi:hypothetical protein
MKNLKKLLVASFAVSILFSGGNAQAVTKPNADAFYAIAQQAFAYGVYGNKFMALLTCETFLTAAVPDADDPTLAATRRGLRNQCTNAIAGPGGGGTNIGPFPIFNYPF